MCEMCGKEAVDNYEFVDDYEHIGASIGRLVKQKQEAYGDSFGKSGDIMRKFYPDGIPVDKMDDALTIVRIVDKLSRIAQDNDSFGEDPYADIAGYSILACRRNAMNKNRRNI